MESKSILIPGYKNKILLVIACILHENEIVYSNKLSVVILGKVALRIDILLLVCCMRFIFMYSDKLMITAG